MYEHVMIRLRKDLAEAVDERRPPVISRTRYVNELVDAALAGCVWYDRQSLAGNPPQRTEEER